VERITVRVSPRSARNEVTGWAGSELVVRVTAPPEGGKANAAVEKTVAEALGVAKSRVRVVRGHTARVKQLEIDTERVDISKTFGEPDPGLF